MAKGKVYIVGIGDDGVEGMTAQARRLLEGAEVLLGPETCASLLPPVLAARLETTASLDELVDRIERDSDRDLVVLASGDPLFYGTARYVCGRLGKDRFEVVPHVSSMQLAFARVKESWEEAFLANLSGQSIERVIDRVRSSETVGWPARFWKRGSTTSRPTSARIWVLPTNASLKAASPISPGIPSARSM